MFGADLFAARTTAIERPQDGRVRVLRAARPELVVFICLVLVGFTWAVWPEPGLADRRGEFDKETARYFNLPEGKAQIGVSSVGSRYLTVRWRDRDGRTWTGPQTVYDAGKDQMYDGMRIRVAGPTLALYARFVPMPDPSEDFNGYPSGTGYNVYVVCRDGGCATSRDYDGAIDVVPQITPDGEHVLLAHRGEHLVTWDGGEIEEHRPTGLPDGDYGDGQTLLAPDGSLRAVRGVPAEGGCEFTLLTTEPGKSDFEPAVTHQDTADTREECSTTLESFASDYVVVVGDSEYRPWFAARTGEGWRTASRGPERSGPLPADQRVEDRGRVRHQRVLALAPGPGHVARRPQPGRPGASSGRREMGSTAGGRSGT